MTAPKTTLYQMNYKNPHASKPLTLPVLVLCNTPTEELEENIKRNTKLDLNWIGMNPPQACSAIMVGGGPSLAESIPEIRRQVAYGSVVFAMNGASAYLTSRNIPVHYQVIADAKPETATLIDPEAEQHLLASQVAPVTMDAAVPFKRVWHLAISEDMDRLFPEERRKRGGYALVGGGASVGNTAMALAYVMGFRRFDVFGYDSSHRGAASHAYPQPMNDFIPNIEVEWAGKTFLSSVAMKSQAEKFQVTGQTLKQAGCTIRVHGDGLLPTMWNTPAGSLKEKDKYRLMWSVDQYRDFSPGEDCVEQIMECLKPDGLVIDYGCGTGRASLELSKRGLSVLLVDFADNCRDEEAMALPFLEWDLSKPLPCASDYGICCDVMEHVPGDQVNAVLTNIINASRKVYFQISTMPDDFGALLGGSLHLSVNPASWWEAKFKELGFHVEWQESDETACRFVVHRAPSSKGTD
jgi:SAM-dependent methyltransferase